MAHRNRTLGRFRFSLSRMLLVVALSGALCAAVYYTGWASALILLYLLAPYALIARWLRCAP